MINNMPFDVRFWLTVSYKRLFRVYFKRLCSRR